MLLISKSPISINFHRGKEDSLQGPVEKKDILGVSISKFPKD